MHVVERSRANTAEERARRRAAVRIRRNSRSDASRTLRPFQLPPRRALIGGALVALAAMGVFVAHRNASTPPETRYLVASRDVSAGTVLTSGDLGSVALDLPNDMNVVEAEGAAELIGRVASTNLNKLDLVSPTDVYSDGRFAATDSVEVALDLPAARALAGLVRPGSMVDVLSTDTNQGGTEVLAQEVRVSSVDESRTAAIGSSGAVRVVLSVNGSETARALVDASLRAELTLVLPRPTPVGEP
ncbi:MAG: RcpC/CpaB family pilus assembly protein [Microthrixaceae bacterium]